MSVLDSNTTLSPSKPRSVTTKRKRSGSNVDSTTTGNDNSASASASSSHPAPRTATTPTRFDDILQVLQSHNHASPILEASLNDTKPSSAAQSPSKRSKLASKPHPRTIASQLKDGAYPSLDRLNQDIKNICAALIKSLMTTPRPSSEDPNEFIDKPDHVQAASPAPDNKTSQRLQVCHIQGFQSFALKVIKKATRELMSTPSHEQLASQEQAPNGVKSEVKNNASPADETLPNTRTILSVFGNASTPRQLFSSLQQTDPIDVAVSDVPLEHLGLPNMMSASKVLPSLPESVSLQDPSELTIGKVFRPPASLALLHPPKHTNPSVQPRKSIITFTLNDLLPAKQTRHSGYTAQPLATGRWLGYGHDDCDPIRPVRKRKHRDSTVATRTTPHTDLKQEHGDPNAYETSLFQSAFSSFAPSHDDSHAVVPQRDLNSVWWRRSGTRRFEYNFTHTKSGAAKSPVESFATEQSSERLEDQRFKAAVERTSEYDVVFADLELPPLSISEEPAEQLIAQVDDLIGSLISYQLIRNSQSTTAASTQRKTSASLSVGTDPSDNEMRTFRSLRSRLAELVARLPPYVLAKHHGEQFETLRLKTRLRVPGQQHTGVLEEDQLTRMAKSAAAAAAALAAAPVKNSASATQAQTSYGRNPALAQNAIRASRASQANTSYSRTVPGSNYNTPVTAGRQSFSQLGNYSAPANRTMAQYNLTNGPSQTSRGSTYTQTNGRVSPQVGSPAAPPKSTYQARAPSHVPNASLAKPIAGASSPASTMSNPTMPLSNGQVRPVPASVPIAQTNPPSDQHQRPSPADAKVVSPAGTPQPGPAPNHRAPSNLGPTGFHTSMSTEQQQLMMERQRAQLAAQPQVRFAAQSDATKAQSPAPQALSTAALSNGTDAS